MTTLTSGNNATGTLECYFDIGMSGATLETTGNYNVTPSLSVVSASALDTSIVAWYPTNDCAGTTVYNSGSAGTAINGTFAGTGGNLPSWNCASGTGSVDYDANEWVDYGTDSAWDMFGASSGWTVSAWINMNVDANYSPVFAKVNNAGAYEFMLVIFNMSPTGYFGGWNNSAEYDTISLNTWTMVSWTWSGGTSGATLKMYVNGVLKGTHTGKNLTEQTSYNVYTGAWLGGSYPFYGDIDNVFVSSEVKTAAELVTLYNSGRDVGPLSDPTTATLTVTGVDPSQPYVIDVNSSIVDGTTSNPCTPNSASFLVSPGTSNLSAEPIRTITNTVTESLTVEYFQRVYDAGTAGWCYYTKTSIDATPSAGETTPNYTGAISNHSVVQILEIY